MPIFCIKVRLRPSKCLSVSLLGLLCLSGGLCSSASASPIIYRLKGLFSGSLNGQSFSDQEGTFLLSGSDTNDVTTSDQVFFFNTVGKATFQLATQAAVNILSPAFGVESETNAASFLDIASDFAAAEYNELNNYDVLSEYWSTTGGFVSYGTQAEEISDGALVLTGATGDVTLPLRRPPPSPLSHRVFC